MLLLLLISARLKHATRDHLSEMLAETNAIQDGDDGDDSDHDNRVATKKDIRKVILLEHLQAGAGTLLTETNSIGDDSIIVM